MSYFENKNVLVTGGASGIGLEICSQLVDQKANVLLTDLNETITSKKAISLGCHWASLNVTDLKNFESCIRNFEEEHGPIDILFNNAGIERTGEAHDYEYEDWKQIIDVNVYGVINGVHCMYPKMVDRGSGQIVNIASIAGLFPSAGQVSYSTSKYAVVGLSHALRAEAVNYGVKINVICPGIIKTPMRENLQIKGNNSQKMLDIIPEGLDVKKCVQQILKGVQKNKGTTVITPMAKALWTMNRLNPSLSTLFGSKVIRWMKEYD